MTTPITDASPAEIDKQLRWLHDEIGRAGKMLRDAMKAEAVAMTDWIPVDAAATLHPDCPPVGRGEGEYTVRYRDAWLYQRNRTEIDALRAAQARVKAGKEYMKELREQVSTIQSINATSRASFNAYGNVR